MLGAGFARLSRFGSESIGGRLADADDGGFVMQAHMRRLYANHKNALQVEFRSQAPNDHV
jgi:hypothetical protein